MLPTDLSLWHLHTTGLYWVLLAALVIELAWMAPPTVRALMAAALRTSICCLTRKSCSLGYPGKAGIFVNRYVSYR